MQDEEPRADGSLGPRREELARWIGQFGGDPVIADQLVHRVSADQLVLLEALVAQLRPVAIDARASESMPLAQYRELLDGLGNEYIGNLTRAGLATFVPGVSPELLQEGAEALAGISRLMLAVPMHMRPRMWESVHGEIANVVPHYKNIKQAMSHTGIAAALDAEQHAVLANLRREAIPDVDLAVLRMVGESDPERTMRAIIRAARSAPDATLKGMSVTDLLGEAEVKLQELSPTPSNDPHLPSLPTPKRWTGWGKIFTGMAIAGVNIAGGLVLSAGGGPFTADTTVGGVLASCGLGIGHVSEGVGALRGE